MEVLFRDTAFGQLVRLISGRRLFKYPEEKDPSLWKQCVKTEKTDQMRRGGADQTVEDAGGNISHEQGAQDLEPRQNVQNGSLSGNPLATDEALKEQSTSNGAGTPNTGGVLPADTTDPQYNQSGAVELGYENSKKVYVIDWYGPDDPEVYQSDEIESSAKKLMYMQNPMNWSSTIRFWITFEICFLTFAVYIGRAIFSAGELDAMAKFGVGEVVATLGLTTFVL